MRHCWTNADETTIISAADTKELHEILAAQGLDPAGWTMIPDDEKVESDEGDCGGLTYADVAASEHGVIGVA